MLPAPCGGVLCCCDTPHHRYLNLGGNGLNGSLPNSISGLTALRYARSGVECILERCNFDETGCVGVAVVCLVVIPGGCRYLDVHGNGVNGTIPSTLTALAQLTYVGRVEAGFAFVVHGQCGAKHYYRGCARC